MRSLTSMRGRGRERAHQANPRRFWKNGTLSRRTGSSKTRRRGRPLSTHAPDGKRAEKAALSEWAVGVKKAVRAYLRKRWERRERWERSMQNKALRCGACQKSVYRCWLCGVEVAPCFTCRAGNKAWYNMRHLPP